jgi:hypothetical protein
MRRQVTIDNKHRGRHENEFREALARGLCQGMRLLSATVLLRF